MSEKALGSFGQFLRGKGIPKGHITPKGGLPCIRYAEIYTIYGDVVHEFVSRVSKENAKKSVAVRQGDVLFPTSGETAEAIGKAVAYLGAGIAYAGGDTLIFRDHNQNPTYLAYALNAWQATKQKSRLATGSSVIHLYASDLGNVKVWLPPLAEQERIAEILSDADIAIDLAEKLLEKEKVNSRVSIKILLRAISGKTIPLGKAVDFQKGKAVKLSQNGKGLPYIGSKSFEGEFSAFTNDSAGIPCKESDVLLLWDGDAGKATTGLSGIVGSTVARLRPKPKNKNYFLYGVLSENLERIHLMREGSAIMHLPRNFLEKFEIPLVSESKQSKIASLIIAQRKKHACIESQIAALKKQKRGLMQQLLTGKIRVLPKNNKGGTK